MGMGVNCGMTVRELIPLDLIMERFVSATARCARSRSSSDSCLGAEGLVRVTVVVVVGTGGSNMVSSSMGTGDCAGEWYRVSRGISISWSLEKMRELMVGVVALSSDSVGGTCEMYVRGDGDGVEGVGVPSAGVSPSSIKTLGGKNCEPVRWCLGRDWRVPMGDGRALMFALLTLDKSFIASWDGGYCCLGRSFILGFLVFRGITFCYVMVVACFRFWISFIVRWVVSRVVCYMCFRLCVLGVFIGAGGGLIALVFDFGRCTRIIAVVLSRVSHVLCVFFLCFWVSGL